MIAQFLRRDSRSDTYYLTFYGVRRARTPHLKSNRKIVGKAGDKRLGSAMIA